MIFYSIALSYLDIILKNLCNVSDLQYIYEVLIL